MAASNSASSFRPPLLRRDSHSSPHLDIPHFLSVQDKGFHPFHATLSGLEKMDKMTGEAGQTLPTPKPGFDRNKSAFELCSADSEGSAPLRKVSTAANFNNVDGAHHGHNDSLLSTALHYVTGNSGSHAVQSHQNEDQGLTMNVRSGSAFGPSALSSASGALGSAGQSDLSSGSPTSDSSSSGTLNRVKSGMFGMFNHGFFAKPVMHDKQESYRYLLTLDR
ncbi:hypothetical protein M3Y99_00486200 [Aphelenchoides fujianensis]|nr:hypothetical protein M3Y99_00486200 [Aphelenchoides fujianensis]